MSKKYIYTYGGKDYTFNELADLIMYQAQLEENKRGFWKSTTLLRYPFQVGFSEGILIGCELARLDNPQVKVRVEEEPPQKQEQSQ